MWVSGIAKTLHLPVMVQRQMLTPVDFPTAHSSGGSHAADAHPRMHKRLVLQERFSESIQSR